RAGPDRGRVFADRRWANRRAWRVSRWTAPVPTPGSRRLCRIELAIPIQEVAPALVQVVGREGAAVFLQFAGGRLVRGADRQHADMMRQAVALAQVARRAGGQHVAPGGATAQ